MFLDENNLGRHFGQVSRSLHYVGSHWSGRGKDTICHRCIARMRTNEYLDC